MSVQTIKQDRTTKSNGSGYKIETHAHMFVGQLVQAVPEKNLMTFTDGEIIRMQNKFMQVVRAIIKEYGGDYES
jgi:hypothetical protein